jgi:hypothetical protein
VSETKEILKMLLEEHFGRLDEMDKNGNGER